MTDEDPHSPEQNPEGQEAEAWTDDQPPVDDFADPEQTGEGEATISHETETPAEETPAANAGARKPMLLPIAAGIGGIIFLGAMAWFQFGRSSPPPRPSPMMTAMKTPAPVNPVPAAMQPASSSGAVDMNALYASAQQVPPAPAAVASSAPLAPSAPSATVPPASGVLETAPTTSLVMPGTVSAAAPVATSNAAAKTAVLSAPPSAIGSMPPAMPVSAPPPSSVTPANESEERLAALTARLDDLSKSLDHINSQLTQLGGMAATNSALDERLDRVEQQVLQMKHNQESGPAEMALPVRNAVHKTAAHKTTTASHAAKTHAAKPAEKSAASKSVPHWVLRAATPNEAWVSETANSPELRHVQTGDTLPGIGRVSAIRQMGDHWVIEGASGSVR